MVRRVAGTAVSRPLDCRNAVKIGDAVHVLHAFQKKSKSGIATPQPDVGLIEKRLKAVLTPYAVSRRT